jgi:histidine phosphotransfer protein HptB
MICTTEPIYSTLTDDEELLELVELFVSELPERTGMLEEQLSRGDLLEVGRLAHQLKGAAGSYGFDDVTPYAAKLEQIARAGESTDAAVAALNELIEICGRLRSGRACA